MSTWVHYGTLLTAAPQLMNKNGEFEYAAVHITQFEHRLSYTPCVVRLKEKLKVVSQEPHLHRFEPQNRMLVQHISAGQSFQAFAQLFAYIQVQEQVWLSEVARSFLSSKRKAG